MPNDIVVHIRMLDGTAQLQQEAVGVLGINLIHAAFTLGDDTAAIISSLLAELSRSRLEARAAPLYSATWRESNPATLRPVPSDTCLLVLLSYCTLHGAALLCGFLVAQAYFSGTGVQRQCRACVEAKIGQLTSGALRRHERLLP